ncbi:MAG: transketolase [Bacteroidota bacterium]
MTTVGEMQRTAQQLRVEVIKMIYQARSGHSGGSLSCAEILTVLYERFLRIRPTEPNWPDRDRFILSKGHAAPALYVTLSRKGYFEPALLGTLRQLNSCLQGHPCMFKLPGVEMSTGSLGMGISVGIGMALSARTAGKDYRTFVLCGDGELQEGQNWEALMAAAKWNLANLTVIIDRNHVQLDGKEADIMPLGDLTAKIKAFGMNTLTCDGHNVESLITAFESALGSGEPSVIIAETVKGKGVSFMENQSAWHGKQISDADYDLAIRELEEGLG